MQVDTCKPRAGNIGALIIRTGYNNKEAPKPYSNYLRPLRQLRELYARHGHCLYDTGSHLDMQECKRPSS